MRCIVNKKHRIVNAMQRFVEHFGDTTDGTRTRTARRPGDFKSPASTDSATVASNGEANCTRGERRRQFFSLFISCAHCKTKSDATPKRDG